MEIGMSGNTLPPPSPPPHPAAVKIKKKEVYRLEHFRAKSVIQLRIPKK